MSRTDASAPAWRPSATWCAICTLAALFCAADARPEVIWEGDDQSVQLAPQDVGTRPNDHPVSLDAPEVERMLEGLRFTHADGTDASPAPVFNADQVRILGEALAAGLARAAPSQDVTFSLVGAHRLSPGAFARRNRLTAGRAFYQEGKLNVIFGEIQGPYRKKNIYGRIEQDFSPRQYGSRTNPQVRESVLVAGPGLLANTQGSARVDWAVLDPATSAASPAETIAVADRALPAPDAKPAAAPAEAAGPGSMEQRLQVLRDLREKELISEEAYQRRVDEILREL